MLVKRGRRCDTARILFAMRADMSNPISGQTCENCCFWRPEAESDPSGGWGQCRRMPPTPPPIDQEKLVHVGVWPSTQATDWCGEWRATPADRER